MQKKLPILLFIVAAIAQFTYKTQLNLIMSKPMLRAIDYQIFTDEFRSMTVLAALILLLAVIFLLPLPNAKENSTNHRFWYWGSGAIFFLSIVVVAYVNPQGRFPWNKHANYIEIETRSRKVVLYKSLAQQPDLIVFGSSVSFLMPMNYFEETWGMRAFNMSVSGGGTADFVNLYNIIKDTQNFSPPLVVMVEVLNTKLENVGARLTPLEYIVQMGTVNEQYSVIQDMAQSIFRANAVSDALFTRFIVDKERWSIITNLENDGTLINQQKELNDKQYRKMVEDNAFILDSVQSCEALDENGKRNIEKLVALSREHKFSLVIYRTPINEDFYNFSTHKPSDYAECEALFTGFMENIAAQNSNVFFTDLSHYKEITTGGKEFYRDTHHLTAQGHIALLEALNNEIESALEWARKNR